MNTVDAQDPREAIHVSGRSSQHLVPVDCTHAYPLDVGIHEHKPADYADATHPATAPTGTPSATIGIIPRSAWDCAMLQR